MRGRTPVQRLHVARTMANTGGTVSSIGRTVANTGGTMAGVGFRLYRQRTVVMRTPVTGEHILDAPHSEEHQGDRRQIPSHPGQMCHDTKDSGST